MLLRAVVVIAICLAACLASADPFADVASIGITSPSADSDLYGEKQITIRWECPLADSATYSILYSTDGARFDHVIASGLKTQEYTWTPKESDLFCSALKVKAFGSRGEVLNEAVVPVRLLPKTVILVSKADQKVYHYVDGKLQETFICSTALPQYDLEPGRYKVYYKDKKHWSREYEVWMPNSLFFHEGYALHATSVIRRLGHPASHGCVRLRPKDAETLFNRVKVGTPVIVLPKSTSCESVHATCDALAKALTAPAFVALRPRP